jgi:hypothetical protein
VVLNRVTVDQPKKNNANSNNTVAVTSSVVYKRNLYMIYNTKLTNAASVTSSVVEKRSPYVMPDIFLLT